MEEKTKAKISAYFSNLEWLTYAIIILAGVMLRWLELDARPYHHDESQHAMFGKYFYDFPDIQFYKYDPMMHAPLLYNFFRLVYTALGNTLWSARAPVALLGTLFLFLPLLFRQYFSKKALLVLTASIALSPSLVYWSRFLIHDYFVILAMIITLYGVVLARAEQKAFFVLIGITLQFCIKANVFVTIAMLFGYLVYDLLLNYFTSDDFKGSPSRAKDFIWKNVFLFPIIAWFFIIASALTMALHFGISYLDSENKLWKALIAFSNDTLLFVGFNLVTYLLIFCLIFFVVDSKESYFKKIYENIRAYIWQFALSVALSILTFCYIFSSGFRNIKGILDGLFRTSIPYWLNQHDIERIKGPFLFNFYMLSWYELAFMIFFIFQLFLFYRSAPRFAKISGIVLCGVGFILSLLALWYISPDKLGLNWHNLEEIGNKDPKELKTFIDKLMTHFVHFFKLKDCLDVFGLVLILGNPVIITTTHILRRERILAFWGYLFTASFFTYSFLGEKVPWLSMYPLIPGFIYLTLYFDEWFKSHPLENYEEFPVSRIFKYVSTVMLFLFLFFTLENIVSISSILSSFDISKFFNFFTAQGFDENYKLVKTGIWDNLFLFTLGISFYALYFFNERMNILGRVNLFKFLFVVVSLFCLRGSILTNFVYGGSETEFISQVHTTKEFHSLAVRLRKEALSNIRPAEFTILGDGDPVWPLTWYMVGVDSFKFIANEEERKNFDVIIQTFDEQPKNVPPGFEKRKITLRGWWVPDYNQMSLKKFLNVSVNHIPWSPSGFTYAWLFINKNKH
jgi:predicted membrane-bound mannosyltransferase